MSVGAVRQGLQPQQQQEGDHPSSLCVSAHATTSNDSLVTPVSASTELRSTTATSADDAGPRPGPAQHPLQTTPRRRARGRPRTPSREPPVGGGGSTPPQPTTTVAHAAHAAQQDPGSTPYGGGDDVIITGNPVLDHIALSASATTTATTTTAAAAASSRARPPPPPLLHDTATDLATMLGGYSPKNSHRLAAQMSLRESSSPTTRSTPPRRQQPPQGRAAASAQATATATEVPSRRRRRPAAVAARRVRLAPSGAQAGRQAGCCLLGSARPGPAARGRAGYG